MTIIMGNAMEKKNSIYYINLKLLNCDLLITAFFAFFISSAVQASSLTYFRQMSGLEVKEALVAHRELYLKSKALRFLDCPLEMIERQWGGVQSVTLGISYLEQYLNEAKACEPNYASITKRCQQDLRLYRRKDKNEEIVSRKIEGEEMTNFVTRASSMQNEGLANAVISSLNQPTRCYTQRIATSLGYLLVGSAGYYQMECFTPLGRHFALGGPSFGVGIGAIAAYSMPNIDALNTLSYQMLLYQRPEKKTDHHTHYVTEIAAGVGCSIEHDFGRILREGQDAQSFLCDFRPAIGAGMATENIHSFLHRKRLNPLYMKLDNILDLGAMVRAQY